MMMDIRQCDPASRCSYRDIERVLSVIVEAGHEYNAWRGMGRGGGGPALTADRTQKKFYQSKQKEFLTRGGQGAKPGRKEAITAI